MSLDRLSYFKKYLILVLLLFSQYIVGLNLLTLVVTSIILFYGLVKKSEFALSIFLVLPFGIADSGINIYSVKGGPLSITYLIIGAVFFIYLIFRPKIRKEAYWFSIFVFVYVAYSIVLGNPNNGSYFIIDAVYLFITTITLVILCRYDTVDFDNVLLPSGLAFYTVKIIIILTGIGVETISYSSSVDQDIAMFDPIENFFVIYVILKVFDGKSERLKRIYSFLTVVLFVVISVLQGYVNGGTIIIVLCVVFYILFYSRFVLINALIVATLSISIGGAITMTNNSDDESVMLYKLEKVIGLLTFAVDQDLSIYDLPRSTQVRMIETGNIISQPFYFLLLGKGLGGDIEEIDYFYGEYLNSHDYPEDQLATGRYITMHTYNQILLKHGLLSIIVLIYLKCRYFITRDPFADACLIFVIFSYAFTLKPFIILAMLLYYIIRVRDGKRDTSSRYAV